MTTRTKQPTDKLPRVYRGGGWSSTDPSMLRSADRDGFTPAIRYNFFLGFRCAQRGCKQPLKGTPPP